MAQKFGEVSWDEVPSENGPQRENNRDLFMRLEKGSNVIRVITPPFQYIQHRYKREGDPGYGQRVMCSITHGSCPLCALGDKAKRRWLLGVIDRRTKAYKVLDISIAVFKQVQALTRDDEWGDPSRYDVDIKVDPNGGATGYYTVTPKIPKPLSADDTEIRDMLDLDDLKRRCAPPEPSKVQERLDKITTGTPARSGSPAPTQSRNTYAQSAPSAAPAQRPQVDMSEDEDEDNILFPAYDAKSR